MQRVCIDISVPQDAVGQHLAGLDLRGGIQYLLGHSSDPLAIAIWQIAANSGSHAYDITVESSADYIRWMMDYRIIITPVLSANTGDENNRRVEGPANKAEEAPKPPSRRLVLRKGGEGT